MNGRAALAAMALTVLVFAQDIHLKTRVIQTRARTAGVASPRSGAGARRAGVSHQIVQFDHPPGVDDLDTLAGTAIVVNALPDNAVVVSGSAVETGAGVSWVGIMEPADKVSPDLNLSAPDEVTVVIDFHPDVGRETQDRVLARGGIRVARPPSLLPNHALVTAPPAEILGLTENDEVSYVFPADTGLSTGEELSPCAGMLTLAGAVAQYANIVHGWDVEAGGTARLSYVFGSLTPRVPAKTVQTEVVRAMNEWSGVANVVFQPGTAQSAARTIVVKFVSGAHGDAYSFDGPAGTLAHTFYPLPVNPESIAGDMHLDADERWNAGGDLDIYSVALHETGHAIGLGHSDKPGDVMYPYYRRGMVLSKNDIGAARFLYGAPGEASAVVTQAPVVTPLRLSVDPVAGSVQSSTFTISGTLEGGTPPLSVQWQSDQGYGGSGAKGNGGSWTASGISLVNGVNTITVTGFDSARRTASASVAVTKAMPSTGSLPVAVTVTSPSGSVATVNKISLALTGKASGGTGITRVTWQTAAGRSGNAIGTERWSVAAVPLLVGTNTVVVRAYDSSGQAGWASLVVIRR